MSSTQFKIIKQTGIDVTIKIRNDNYCRNFPRIKKHCEKNDKIICFKIQMIPLPPPRNVGCTVPNQRFTILSFFKEIKMESKQSKVLGNPLSRDTRSLDRCILFKFYFYTLLTYIRLHILPYTCIYIYSFTRNILSSPMMPLSGESWDSILFKKKKTAV